MMPTDFHQLCLELGGIELGEINLACDRMLRHRGLHSWELAGQLIVARVALERIDSRSRTGAAFTSELGDIARAAIGAMEGKVTT